MSAFRAGGEVDAHASDPAGASCDLVTLRDVVFAYDKACAPFRLRVDLLSVRPGEVCYLFGPSGCGKTTILGLLTGLIPLKTGYWNRAPELEDGRRQAYVTQRSTLLPWLSIRKNIQLDASFRRLPVHEDLLEQTADVVDLTREDLDKLPGELSGGMLSRAQIMRALCMAPRLMVFDEAFNGVDAERRRGIMDEVFRRVDGDAVGVVACSQLPIEVLLAADRVLLLNPNGDGAMRECLIPTPRRDRSRAWLHSGEANDLLDLMGWLA